MLMKRVLKIFLISTLVIIVIAVLGYILLNKPLPDGEQGIKAEQLADKVLQTLNKPAYDSLEFIEFEFRNKNHYQWDKKKNTVMVKWDDQEVYLDLNRSVHSFSLLELRAYEFFINDSFWLVAPFKIRDKGTELRYVDLGDKKGLLVTYTSGGLTPGDSYLWTIDENGVPESWQLWTSNVAIGGLSFSWDGWWKYGEVWFSNVHKGKFVDIPMSIISVR